jgi:protein-tyrosine phosphatase
MLAEMPEPWIVDVHSHLVPTGDDGVGTIEEGLRLCRRAFEHGTRVLYATPHVHAQWDSYPLTEARLRRYEQALPVLRSLCAGFGLDLRRGFEVYPGAVPPETDLRDFELDGVAGCLIEFPGSWTHEPEPVAAVWQEAERAEAAGLLPILAHPERCSQVVADPECLLPFRERGWLLAPNAPSLVGRHGAAAERTVWRLLDTGLADLIASDAHSESRGPELDWACELVAARYGATQARRLFDGSALEPQSEGAEAA